jgi:thioredoxin 1
MIERVLIVAALAVLVIIAFYVFRALHARSIEHGTAGAVGRPTLLYFRADSCAVCPTQGRIIDQLAGEWSDRIDIWRIDADREPETAARYRVLSLPTTILVDAGGRVVHVNYGLADASKLARQLSALGGEQAGQPIAARLAVKSVPTD